MRKAKTIMQYRHFGRTGTSTRPRSGLVATADVNLAAAVCLKARETGGVSPAFQLLIYPAVDPPMDLPSAHDNAEGYALTTAAMRWFWDHYVPHAADRLEEAEVTMVWHRYAGTIHGFL